ncbi:MAG: aspartate-semialdehyde dehydrogenase [Candidatus Pelagibacter sp.]|nr:aspartate-semialdehyde dehydrogenase [Candidatus Pelagibacter sp.]OUW24320.1 MAG: aspartate-semialdehyde dehydrogenase [Rickettsiales bacterium TMED174]|tara:strand:- start:78 stop:1064 length:987 start_codon:yes stop_codon:yes gene_type:complete
MNLAIIGATGNVGRKTVEILEKSTLKIDKLFLVASQKSLGKKIEFRKKQLKIIELDSYKFSDAEITFFAAGSKIAEKWVPIAAKETIVIDNSKYFRMKKEVPLVVTEVNSEDLAKHNNIISNPNCSTIQLVLVLKPLHDRFKIKRVVVSTYQAVSGAGKAAMDELLSQTHDHLGGKEIISKNFTKQIAFNVIPHIDSFVDGGYTNEEWKMEHETQKILDKNVKVTATCVRVPVKTSHSESVNIEFEKDYDLKELKNILSRSPGCKVIDEQVDGGYITPVEAEGEYKTYISRIRKDNSNNKAVNLWIVSDNLLKGAALNTVQIAEELVK